MFTVNGLRFSSKRTAIQSKTDWIAFVDKNGLRLIQKRTEKLFIPLSRSSFGFSSPIAFDFRLDRTVAFWRFDSPGIFSCWRFASSSLVLVVVFFGTYIPAVSLEGIDLGLLPCLPLNLAEVCECVSDSLYYIA